MRALYCICAGLALLSTPALAQSPSVVPTSTEYTVFVQGVPLGREDVLVRTGPEGTTIVTQGRTVAPVNTVLRHVEFRYGPDGSPSAFVLQGSVGGTEIDLRTEFRDGSAVSTGARGDTTVSTTQQVSPQSLIIPNGIFGGFAALASRLSSASAGDEFRLLIVPGAEIPARLTGARTERIQTGTSTFEVTRYDLLLEDPAGGVVVIVTVDSNGSLVRISVPERSIEVLRSDLAGVSSRMNVYSNPGDEAVMIPAPGFNLAATVTMPKSRPAPSEDDDDAARMPAVVLVPGQNAPDRDTLIRGVPVMAQLAGALADAGFIVVRYDRRGSGQSGGRAESATISDYAEDVRTVVRWLSSRKDVDRDRIGVVGHRESAWVAMLAAEREDRIAALVTLAAPSLPGTEMALEQQQRQLDQIQAGDEERATQTALQKQIHEAVLTGAGWEGIPEEMRVQADTPFFESLLEYEPAEVIDDVEGAVLIVHGDADREMPVAHAERLAELARTGDSDSVELVIARGVTHYLTSADATAGAAGPAASRTLDPSVATAVTEWFARTLPEPEEER